MTTEIAGPLEVRSTAGLGAVRHDVVWIADTGRWKIAQSTRDEWFQCLDATGLAPFSSWDDARMHLIRVAAARRSHAKVALRIAEDTLKRTQAMKTPAQIECTRTLVSNSGLDARTKHCLAAECIEYVEHALAMSDRELLAIPNFGRISLARLRAWSPAAPNAKLTRSQRDDQ